MYMVYMVPVIFIEKQHGLEVKQLQFFCIDFNNKNKDGLNGTL